MIEVVITASVFLVVILGLAGTYAIAVKASLENVTKVKATFLEEEGLEAVRLMRDLSWADKIATQVTGVPFYLVFDGATWTAVATSDFIGGIFERKITLTDVYRDSSQNIVSSGGTLDPNIKKVTSAVSWFSRGATTTRSLSTYLTNVFDN